MLFGRTKKLPPVRVRAAPSKFEIIIVYSKCIRLDGIHPSDTIRELIKRINSRLQGESIDSIWFRGTKLEDQSTVAQSHLSRGDRVTTQANPFSEQPSKLPDAPSRSRNRSLVDRRRTQPSSRPRREMMSTPRLISTLPPVGPSSLSSSHPPSPAQSIPAPPLMSTPTQPLMSTSAPLGASSLSSSHPLPPTQNIPAPLSMPSPAFQEASSSQPSLEPSSITQPDLIKEYQLEGITPMEAVTRRACRNAEIIHIYFEKQYRVALRDIQHGSKVSDVVERIEMQLQVSRSMQTLRLQDRGDIIFPGPDDILIQEWYSPNNDCGELVVNLEVPQELYLGDLNYPEWSKGMLDEFRRDNSTNNDWSRKIHPDGKPYYICSISNNAVLVTDDDNPHDLIHVAGIDKAVKTVGDEIATAITESMRIKREDLIIFLSVDLTRLGALCYYIVSTKWLNIFWLDEPIRGQLEALGDDDSIEKLLSCNFLSHVENFPTTNQWQDKRISRLKKYLRQSLVYSSTEQLLFPDKAVSLFQDHSLLFELLGQFNVDTTDLEDASDDTSHRSVIPWYSVDGYENWFVATALGKLLSPTRLRTYGSSNCPSYRNPSPLITKETLGAKLSDIAFSILSFGVFRGYAKRLQTIWRDRKVTVSEWRNLQRLLEADWTGSNLLATVLLSANIGFLALSNTRASGITCGVISALFSLGSIAVGLYNASTNRNIQVKFDSNPEYAEKYFYSAAAINTRLQWLAMLLALPLSFLLWSLSAFAVAILIFAFPGSQSSVASTFQGITLAVVLSSVLILMSVHYLGGYFKGKKVQRNESRLSSGHRTPQTNSVVEDMNSV